MAMLCTKCGKEINGCNLPLPFIPINPHPRDYITYGGKCYHKECFQVPIKHQLDTINLNQDIKLTDAVNIVNDILVNSTNIHTKVLAYRLSTLIAEHSNEYVLCANCNKLILRSTSVLGERTKIFAQLLQNRFGIVPEDDKHSVAIRIFLFCSIQCDMYFASKLKKELESRIEEANAKFKNFDETYQANMRRYLDGKAGDERDKIAKALEIQLKARKKLETDKFKLDIKRIVKRVLC